VFDPTDLSPFEADLKAGYDLENPDWKYDVIPEMVDGKNVIDYVDPDIDRMLEELEREEEQQQEEFEREMEENDLEVDEEDLQLIADFHRQRKFARQNQMETQQSHGQVERNEMLRLMLMMLLLLMTMLLLLLILFFNNRLFVVRLLLRTLRTRWCWPA
jgi:hypothetical protein